jgi:hypothetical protein
MRQVLRNHLIRVATAMFSVPALGCALAPLLYFLSGPLNSSPTGLRGLANLLWAFDYFFLLLFGLVSWFPIGIVTFTIGTVQVLRERSKPPKAVPIDEGVDRRWRKLAICCVLGYAVGGIALLRYQPMRERYREVRVGQMVSEVERNIGRPVGMSEGSCKDESSSRCGGRVYTADDLPWEGSPWWELRLRVRDGVVVSAVLISPKGVARPIDGSSEWEFDEPWPRG